MKYLFFLLLTLTGLTAAAQPCADEDTVRNNAVSLITATTARVNGTTSHFAATVLSIQLRYVRVGFTDTATASTSGTNPLRNLTGLQPSTTYRYYYNSVCGSGTLRQSGVYTFTTSTASVVYADERSTRFKGYVAADSGFKAPRVDTALYRAAGSAGGEIVFKTSDSKFYGYNGSRWQWLGVDSAGILPALNLKVDSVTVAGDSLFYWVNGTGYGYIMPGAVNIYNTDDTLTGDRIVEGDHHNLTFDNLSSFYLNSNGELLLHNYSLSALSTSAIEAASDYASICTYKNAENLSRVDAFSDSISIKPYRGNLFIDSLNYSSNSDDSILVWRSSGGSRGLVGIRSLSSLGSSISGLTTNYITKAASSSTIANSLLFDNGTNIGLGTASPTGFFHIAQPTPASVATTSVTATAAPFKIIGGNGGATSSSGSTVNAGNAGAISITGGNGGAITGTPTTGSGGAGSNITILAGDGGLGTTFGGAAGSVEVQGGTGGGGTAGGTAGYAALKGGNAGSTGGANGGNIYIVPGIGQGAGQSGSILLGLSPSNTVRGNVVIGTSLDDYTNKLQVTGNSLFTGTVAATTFTGAHNGTVGATTPTTGAFTSLTNTSQVLTSAATTGVGFDASSSTITTGSLMSLTNTGTAAASNTKTVLSVNSSGANATASQTTYGARILNTNTGTTNNNVALYLQASGAASNNFPLIISESGGNYNNNGFAFDNNSMTIAGSGTKRYVSATADIMPSTGVFRWVSGTTNPFGTTDLTMSRVRANWLAIGTSSTVGDSTGNITLSKGIFTGTSTTGSDLSITNSTLTTGSAASIALTGTAAASNTKTGLSITSSGANATSSQTVTGQTISVTNTGTTNTNVGLNVTASGATNNYAALFTGNVGIGTTAPGGRLEVKASSSTSGATDFAFNNSSGANLFKVRNDGYVTLGSGSTASSLDIIGTGSGGVYSPAYSPSSTNIIKFKEYVSGNEQVRMDFTTAGSPLVGIGTASPAASSILDVTSTTKGFLPPRMTTAQRNAIASPATGLTLYCTDCTATDTSTGVMQTYNGTVWKNNW